MASYCSVQRRVLSSSTLNIVPLFICATLASCSNDKQSESSLSEQPPKVSGKKSQSDSRDASADDDESEEDAATRIVTKTKVVDAGAKKSEPKETKKASEPDASKDKEKSKSPSDAGESQNNDGDKDKDKPADAGTKADEPKQEDAAECSRKWLRDKVEVYLQTLSSGDTMPLKVSPNFRYTENGREEQLGGGLWLRRADSQFSRHVLDETSCSTLTEAVMESITGRFSFGVRLHYLDGELLDAEVQFLNELVTNSDLDKIIQKDDDPFVAEVPKDKRASREELFDMARRYFNSVTDAASLPPSADDCHRTQNGLPIGDGTCTALPGASRFQQQRFDVADELTGIATAAVLYDSRSFFYLLKIEDGKVHNIEAVGGVTTLATGW